MGVLKIMLYFSKSLKQCFSSLKTEKVCTGSIKDELLELKQTVVQVPGHDIKNKYL